MVELGAQRIRAIPTEIGTDETGDITFDFTSYLQGRRGIVTRMIAGIVASGAGQALLDSFTRTVAANAWGTPDVGPTYQTSGSHSGTQYSVDGDQGKDGPGGGGLATNGNQVFSPVAVADGQIVGTLSDTGSTPNAATVQGLIARALDASNFIAADIQGNASPYTIQLAHRNAAAADTVLISTTKALTAPIRCRLSFEGSTMQGKWWTETDPEPSTFDLSVTTPNILTGGGGMGGRMRDAAAWSGVLFWDDLEGLDQPTAANPTWDAYIGSPDDPTNLIDSSQGIALPRWVPSLVNGQPVFQGDVLHIVADGGRAGDLLVASCYLVTEPV